MTLRAKLLLAQAPLAVALLVFAVAAVHTLDRLGAASNDILKDNFRSVLAAQRMKEALERIDSAVLFHVAGHRREAPALVEANRAKFEQELAVEERNITEPGERDAARRLREGWTRYHAAVARFLAESEPQALDRAYFGELNPLFAGLKDAADRVLAINQDAMVQRSDEVQRTASGMTGLLVVGAAAALGLGLLSSVTLTARLLGPLQGLSNAVRRLGEGDLEARAVATGQDEIAALAREFNTMAAHLAQFRRSSLGELIEAQQSAQAAIDALPDPVVIFGERGQVLGANRAAADVLGIALEVSDVEPLARVPAAVREVLEQLRAHVLGGRGAWSPSGFESVVRVPSPAGERSLLPRGSPVYSEDGAVTGAAVVLQDVTRLLFFDQFKNDLVATVAHEFRTPLTSLRMAVHLMLEEAAGPVTAKQADLLQAAREETEKLQAIVDDLLDVSRLQGGRVELHRTPTTPRELLEPLEPLGAGAKERGLAFVAEDLTPPGTRVEADRERLGIALTNLVQNALRHTPGGGSVAVRVRERQGRVRFEVSDTGPGIPEEFRERVFDKYFQVPGQSGGGAGLGLYIARELVVAHEGLMGVDSAVGQGTTFWFELAAAGG